MTQMAEKQQKMLVSSDDDFAPIIIKSVIETPTPTASSLRRICWNTGEEKNCPSCYLSKGCKAKT
ncbi:MAG TPA: hypothetical protein VMD05_02895 [Candidatus Nanoarchaeia archaeon]|nr:hypothetical protein [Candidatus Nanoarchaeia archaeon]